MPQGQHDSKSQPTETSNNEKTVTNQMSSSTEADDWTDVTDPNERRKIQNKLAQRRFRDKAKEQKEEAQRDLENRQRAGNSYSTPEPEEIDLGQTLSGLPWGGISLKHVVEKGKSKEQGSSTQKDNKGPIHTARSR